MTPDGQIIFIDWEGARKYDPDQGPTPETPFQAMTAFAPPEADASDPGVPAPTVLHPQQTDVFSFGLLLAFLLRGESIDPMELENIMEETTPPTDALDHLLWSMLRTNPEERPPMRDLLARLEDLAEGTDPRDVLREREVQKVVIRGSSQNSGFCELPDYTHYQK